MTVFQLKYKKHFELCEELLSLTLQALQSIPHSSKPYDEVLTAFFIKATNSFRSVIRLCEEGLGEDAALIVRSLLNLSYLVKWTEQDKNDRAQRFLGWFWKQRIEYVTKCGETPRAEEKAAWDKMRHLFEYTDKKGKTQLFENWYGKDSIRDLAGSLKEDELPPSGYRTHAELHYVEGYKPLSDIEHSNPIASSAFLTRAKGRYFIGYLSSDEVIHEALKGGFQYFHVIFAAWNSSFSVISPETSAELLQTAIEYFKRFEDEEAERRKPPAT